ncbi:hypothetical protein K438DRAFT_1014531 [Mycena galopus ATCC 62051]|nr:hypothetical protein K438DRAFT_1014531 [Mycena galopus ATCC 62051]
MPIMPTNLSIFLLTVRDNAAALSRCPCCTPALPAMIDISHAAVQARSVKNEFLEWGGLLAVVNSEQKVFDND